MKPVLPASLHSASIVSKSFEWLGEEAVKEGGHKLAGVAIDEWHALSVLAPTLAKQRDRLAEALREFLKDEGVHSVGCKEYPPGFDDSRCCPVHMARAALAEYEKKQWRTRGMAPTQRASRKGVPRLAR